MNKRALVTFIIPMVMSSAQAQVTVTPVFDTPWQSAVAPSVAETSTRASSNNITVTPVGDTPWQSGAATVVTTPASARANSNEITVTPMVPKLAVDTSIYGSADCNSWECSANLVANSAATQVTALQQAVAPVARASATERSEATGTEEAPQEIVVTGRKITSAKTKLSYADKLMRYLRVGARYGKDKCGIGLRKIFEAAGLFSRSAQANRNRTESTKLWGRYLEDQGFTNVGIGSPYCNTPGTIRVYNGTQIKVKKRNKGDKHGHIEFVGTDGRFHSSRSSTKSRDAAVEPGRRPLIGCYVKNEEVES